MIDTVYEADVDFYYLSGLSADAAPILASEENYFYYCKKNESMKRYYDKISEYAAECGVRNFNLSRYLAGKAVEACLGQEK